MAEAPNPDFKSPEELETLLKSTAARLHYINRVSGESYFRGELAELINAVAKLAKLGQMPEVAEIFGTGFSGGEVDPQGRKALMLELLEKQYHPQTTAPRAP